MNSTRNKNVKNAAGTLVLSGTNTYSGGTTISAGTLAVQNGQEFNGAWIDRNSLNVGQLTVTQSTTLPNGTTTQSVIAANNAPGFNFNDTNNRLRNTGQGGNGGQLSGAGTVTMNGQSSGAVSQAAATANPNAYFNYGQNASPAQQQELTKAGNGTLMLGYRNAYSGPTVISGGTLQMGNGGTLDMQQRELAQYEQKLKSSNVSIAGGAIDITNGSTILTTSSFGFVPPSQGNGIGPTKATILAGSPRAASHEITEQFRSSGNESGPADRKKEETRRESVTSREGAADKDAAAQAGQSAIPAAPAGLASLDFELPTDASLYQIYRFSTPRGEAELTARTISTSAVARLQSLVAIVAAIIVLWLAIRLVRSGVLGWFRHPLGAALLLVGGIAMLCGGVLPLVALACVGTGLWLLIARVYLSHRAASLAQ